MTFERLPEELAVLVVLQLRADDYHMLTLPLVSGSFQRVCSLPAVLAARLGSRLRQVMAMLADRQLPSDEWAFGHSWGALLAAHRFLSACQAMGSNGLEWLADDKHHLVALSSRCQAMRLPPPTTISAESLFLDAEATKLQRSYTSKERITSGDRAAYNAAAALGLKAEASHEALRHEVQAQMQRQISAACRRSWKTMPSSSRRVWELKAAQATDHWERKRAGTHAAVELATSLARQLGATAESTAS